VTVVKVSEWKGGHILLAAAVLKYDILLLKEVRFAENEGIAENEKLVHDCKKVLHKHAHTCGRADWHRQVVINHPIAISSE
jgi:hypothetical protein